MSDDQYSLTQQSLEAPEEGVPHSHLPQDLQSPSVQIDIDRLSAERPTGISSGIDLSSQPLGANGTENTYLRAPAQEPPPNKEEEKQNSDPAQGMKLVIPDVEAIEEALNGVLESTEQAVVPAELVSHFNTVGLEDISGVLSNIAHLKKAGISDEHLKRFIAAASSLDPLAIIDNLDAIRTVAGTDSTVEQVVDAFPGAYLESGDNNKELVSRAVDRILRAATPDSGEYLSGLLPGQPLPMLLPGQPVMIESGGTLSSGLLKHLHSNGIPADKVSKIAWLILEHRPGAELTSEDSTQPGNQLQDGQDPFGPALEAFEQTIQPEPSKAEVIGRFLKDIEGLPFHREMRSLVRVHSLEDYLDACELAETLDGEKRTPTGLDTLLQKCVRYNPTGILNAGQQLKRWVPEDRLHRYQVGAIETLLKQNPTAATRLLTDKQFNLTDKEKTLLATVAAEHSPAKVNAYLMLKEFLPDDMQQKLKESASNDLEAIGSGSPSLFLSMYDQLAEFPERKEVLQDALKKVEDNLKTIETLPPDYPVDYLTPPPSLLNVPFDQFEDQARLMRVLKAMLHHHRELAPMLIEKTGGTPLEAGVLSAVAEAMKDPASGTDTLPDLTELQLSLADKPQILKKLIEDTIKSSPGAAFVFCEGVEDEKSRRGVLGRGLHHFATADLSTIPAFQLVADFENLRHFEDELVAIDKAAYRKAVRQVGNAMFREGLEPFVAVALVVPGPDVPPMGFFGAASSPLQVVVPQGVAGLPGFKATLTSAVLQTPALAAQLSPELAGQVPEAVQLAATFVESDSRFRSAETAQEAQALVADLFKRVCGKDIEQLAGETLRKIKSEQGFDLQLGGMRLKPPELVMVNSFRGRNTTPLRLAFSLEQLQAVQGNSERFEKLLRTALKQELTAHRTEHSRWSAALRLGGGASIYSDDTAVISFIVPGSNLKINQERAFAHRFNQFHQHGMDIYAVHAENPEIWNFESRNLQGIPDPLSAGKTGIINSLKTNITRAIREGKSTVLLNYLAHGEPTGVCHVEGGETLSGEEVAVALTTPFKGEENDPRNGKPLCELIAIAVQASSCYGESQIDGMIEYFQNRNTDADKNNDIAVKDLFVQADVQDTALALGRTRPELATLIDPALMAKEPGLFDYYMGLYQDQITGRRQGGESLREGVGTFTHAAFFSDRMVQSDSPISGQNPTGRWYSTTRDIDISW